MRTKLQPVRVQRGNTKRLYPRVSQNTPTDTPHFLRFLDIRLASEHYEALPGYFPRWMTSACDFFGWRIVSVTLQNHLNIRYLVLGPPEFEVL